MTLSCQGKEKDSEGCCFALDETSDAIQNRTKLPLVKSLKDTCRIYTKTENEPHHSFSVGASVVSMQALQHDHGSQIVIRLGGHASRNVSYNLSFYM